MWYCTTCLEATLIQGLGFLFKLQKNPDGYSGPTRKKSPFATVRGTPEGQYRVRHECYVLSRQLAIHVRNKATVMTDAS